MPDRASRMVLDMGAVFGATTWPATKAKLTPLIQSTWPSLQIEFTEERKIVLEGESEVVHACVEAFRGAAAKSGVVTVDGLERGVDE